jgi:pyrroloquinoline quinone biosynthesis protein D
MERWDTMAADDARSRSDARPRQVPGILKRDLGTEYVFYDAGGERFHVLNETARDIYLLCDGSRTVHDIARVLTTTRDIDLATATRDTREAIDEMARIGVLRLS